MAERVCVACGSTKPKQAFSGAQWKAKAHSRRCADCVAQKIEKKETSKKETATSDVQVEDVAQSERSGGFVQSIPSSSLPFMQIPEDIPDFSDRSLFPGRLENGQQDELKRLASELCRDKFIQPQSSQWKFTSYLSSAGKMRIDYSRLIPQLADPNLGLSIDSTAFLDARRKYKVFSCLQIQSHDYCWPMQMDPEAAATAAFTVDNVQYVWCMLPKDMPGASSAFHKVLQSMLSGVPNCSVMVDKVLVYSNEMKLHAEHIKAVMDVLRQHGLTPNLQQSTMIQPVTAPAFRMHPCAWVFLEPNELTCTSKMGFTERDVSTSKDKCNGGVDVPGAVLQEHNGAGSAKDQKVTQKAWHLMLTGFWRTHGAKFREMWCSLSEDQMTRNLRTGIIDIIDSWGVAQVVIDSCGVATHVVSYEYAR
jgi:hypothetical protein